MLFGTFRWKAGTDAGARSTFQALVTDLVALQFPTASEVAGPGGSDWGIDTFVGQFDGPIRIWQSKFFPEWKGKPQRRQVQQSFRMLADKATHHGLQVTSWTLCIPCVLPPLEQQWFDSWRTEQQQQTNVTIELWNGVQLRRLLQQPDAETIARRYFLLDGDHALASAMPRVRVRDANARTLGVHAAVQNSAAVGDLPLYVARNADAELRQILRHAVDGGGGCFVLLLGGSSVGKTRTLYEAVRATLPDWWLLHPQSARQVHAFAAAPAPQTVVWLDELQRFMAGADHLTAGAVRAALDAGAAVVATIWPDEYHARRHAQRAGRDQAAESGRELLDLAHVIEIDDAFTDAERRTASVLSQADPRIKDALQSQDYGITQILAAGPELIRAWDQAPNRYCRAVITAAVDAWRLGWRSPIPRALLEDLAPRYLSPRERAAAAADWLDGALEYAAAPLHGAASVLMPEGDRVGNVDGYAVADFLAQHGRRTRRTARLPAGAWAVLTAHVQHPDDAERLADSAHARALYTHAAPLYEQAIRLIQGWHRAAYRLVELWAGQGRVDRAIALAETRPSWPAEYAISDVLASAGQADAAIGRILERYEITDPYVAWRLAELHAGLGNIDAALTLLDPLWFDVDDDPDARADTLRAELLVRAGRLDELRRRALADDWIAAGRLVEHYREHNDLAEAVELLRQLATEHGEWADRYVEVLAEAGDLDEALELDTDGPQWRASQQTRLKVLARHGRFDDLRSLVDNGVDAAAPFLAEHLAVTGQVDELRRRAANGDQAALRRYTTLLADAGDADAALTLFTTAGGRDQWHLAELIARTGKVDDAITLLTAVVYPPSVGGVPVLINVGEPEDLLRFIARHRQVDALRRHADEHPWFAAELLTSTLASLGRLEELRREVDAGTPSAVQRLAETLAGLGRRDEAQQLQRHGLNDDGTIGPAGRPLHLP